MKVLVSWSSGKDSAWTLHALRRDGVNVGALLTSLNEAAGRVSMHGVRENVLRAQADAAGLPLRTIPLPWPCTNEIYEARLGAAARAAVAGGLTPVPLGGPVFGGVWEGRGKRTGRAGA